MLVFCFAGCVISVLLAVYLMLTFDSALLAFVPTLILPSLACWLAGLRRRDVLLMIAIFGTIGWFAGTAFTPGVAMSRQQQIEHRLKLPLAGRDPIVPCAILGSVFAFGRACFVRSPNARLADTMSGTTNPS